MWYIISIILLHDFNLEVQIRNENLRKRKWSNYAETKQLYKKTAPVGHLSSCRLDSVTKLSRKARIRDCPHMNVRPQWPCSNKCLFHDLKVYKTRALENLTRLFSLLGIKGKAIRSKPHCGVIKRPFVGNCSHPVVRLSFYHQRRLLRACSTILVN